MSFKLEFINKAYKIHNNKYDYSLVEYKNNRTKVKIVCPIHSVFEQLPLNHLKGFGCSSCTNNKKYTNNTFAKKSKNIHNDKYDYSLVDYKNNKTKVKIICLKHGIFEQAPYNHIIKKQGCPECSFYEKSNKSFISKSKNIHNDKYDYSLVEYKNNRTKVKIVCPIHSVFEQLPLNHLNKELGCPECLKDSYKNNFLKNAKEIHGDKYDYSMINYKNNRKKIKIMCPTHGIFNQMPKIHAKGAGCPKCCESKGERQLSFILNDMNIKYSNQKTFKDCKYQSLLKFDFYLPKYNLCIEYDGEQHFMKFIHEKNEDKLKLRKKRDKIKNIYCKKNNINLLRIKYNEDIKEKLTNYLSEKFKI